MDRKEYIYYGDRLSDPGYRMKPCTAVRQENGKCIRGRNSNFLVEFPDGSRAVVLGRLLRKTKILSDNSSRKQK
jgi:hypothetical protein